MTPEAARELVIGVLTSVAPDIDPAEVPDDAGLRDSADLDSMDFLDYVACLAEAIGVDIPESDYGRVDTVAGAIAFVVQASG